MKSAILLPNNWKRSFPHPIPCFTMFLLYIFWLFPASSWGFGFLQGFVRDDSEIAIEGARVETDWASTTSLEDGFYLIALPENAYMVTASAAGYESQTVEVTIEDDMTTYQNFSLFVSPLTLKSVTPVWAELGNDLNVTILGTGFDENTRLSMSPDVHNRIKIIGFLNTLGYAGGVTVVGSTAYVADGDSGLQLIDITNPSKPMITGSVETPGYAECLTVVDNTAYVVDLFSGLIIVPTPVEIVPVTIANETQITATLPSPQIAGNYTIQVFNGKQSDELHGAVTFSDKMANSKAIIVAGGGNLESNFLWNATRRCANHAYRALLYQGYRKENIYYLSSENEDIDGNGVLDDVDAGATKDDLSYGINIWVNSGNPVHDLLIYLVGHGGNAVFRLKEDEILKAEHLDDWLDDLQATLPGKLIFVYDAGQSGTFIPIILPPEGKEFDRIVITSAADENALFLMDGKLSFSWQFWVSIFDGANLAEAFSFGSAMMKDYQTACIDANGDGVKNTKQDQIPEITIGRGYKPASDTPVISAVSPDQTLYGETSAMLWASGIIDSDGVEEVWATIIRPDLDPVPPNVPNNDLPTVKLEYSVENDRYEGIYNKFDKLGLYRVSIYAMDYDGMTSLPASTTVYQKDGPDTYEDDDTFDQASVVNLNNQTPLHHNFSDAGDEDWLRFDAIAGVTYMIEAFNQGLKCYVVIELYDTDGISLIEIQDNETDSRADKRLVWQCPLNGTYYVKFRQHQSDVFGVGTEYDLKIGVLQAACKGDFDGDDDVDGQDLVDYVSDSGVVSVMSFAAEFGNSNCLQ